MRRLLGLFVLRNGVGVPSLVKSIQRGTITIAGASTSNTATISGVNVNNSVIRFLGCTVAGVEPASLAFARVELTNATTVTATKGDSDAGADAVVVSYEVVEFVYGIIRSIQRGTIVASAGTATATITAVNTAKSALTYLGISTVNALTDNTWIGRLDLTNATTVTLTATAVDGTVGYEVVEYY